MTQIAKFLKIYRAHIEGLLVKKTTFGRHELRVLLSQAEADAILEFTNQTTEEEEVHG